MSSLHATWLGRVGYLDGWRLQEAVATRVRSGGPDRLLLLEHDPVYTIGRRGSVANLVAPPSELRAHGASAYRVDRGGDITYHGPGQLVGYPVVGLGEAPDLVGYVRALEAAVVDALATYGVAARRIDRKTGVWVELGSNVAKIVAIALAARLDRELRWERDVAPARDDELPADAPVRAAEDLLAEALAS